MTNAPNIPSNRTVIATPELAVIQVTTKEPKLEPASPRPSGVLRELALACWRGSTIQVTDPPLRDDNHN
jgi:hypothetical protein